tara:strand:+ start:646 stop:975 length:330 start_codon:yes stop_codon:yes gene_type:complete
MWALAAARNFENRSQKVKKVDMTSPEENNKKLQEENKRLQEELTFYKSISNFPNSLVGNMFVKYINGKKVWVDRQNISHNKELLHKLDVDNDVLQWIDDLNITFKDNDW